LCLHFIRTISNIAKVFEQNEKEIPDNVKNTLLFEPLKFLKEKSELLIPVRTGENGNEDETEIMMINKNNQVFLGLFTSPDIANHFCKKSGFNFEKTMRSLPIVIQRKFNFFRKNCSNKLILLNQILMELLLIQVKVTKIN
jgi:hypothetical protein